MPGRPLVHTLHPDGRCPVASHKIVVRGPLPAPLAQERDECRGDGVQLAQERSARDRVIGAAAVWSPQKRDRERSPIPARICSANWLAWPGRLVERVGKHPGKAARDETPESVTGGDANGVMERGEMGEAQGSCKSTGTRS